MTEVQQQGATAPQETPQVAPVSAEAAVPVQQTAAAPDYSWLVEATGLKGPEELTQFYQQATAAQSELATLKSQPRFANQLVEKINDLVAKGAGDEDVSRFLNFQKLDVAQIAPEDAVRQWASAKNPAYAKEGVIDDYIEETLGIKGFKDGSYKDSPVMRAKLAENADAARNFIQEQKVAAETPQSVVVAQQVAVERQRMMIENESLASQIAQATKALTFEVGEIIEQPGAKYEFQVPETVTVDGTQIKVNDYVSQVAKAVLNDISIPADQRKPAAEALSALIRKGLVADVMIRDAITSTKQIYLTNRAGATPIVPVGGKLH